jgi:diphthamide synthase (EF-2-diphthine--ammonia ligase)
LEKNTHELINEFIDLGFKTIVTCINEKYLDKSFAGRIIDRDFLQDLPAHVDPCGENGEFHTFVFEGPIFKEKIDFIIGEKTYRKYEDENNSQFDTGFWFCDLNQIS